MGRGTDDGVDVVELAEVAAALVQAGALQELAAVVVDGECLVVGVAEGAGGLADAGAGALGAVIGGPGFHGFPDAEVGHELEEAVDGADVDAVGAAPVDDHVLEGVVEAGGVGEDHRPALLRCLHPQQSGKEE